MMQSSCQLLPKMTVGEVAANFPLLVFRVLNRYDKLRHDEIGKLGKQFGLEKSGGRHYNTRSLQHR